MHDDDLKLVPAPALEPEGPRQPSAQAEAGKRVRRRDLLNLLNLINFREGAIHVFFRHRESGDRLSCRAFPLPCVDESLACRWASPPPRRIAEYEFESILLSDGSSHVAVKAELSRLDSEGIELLIPESGYEKGLRAMDRHPCEGVAAGILQDGMAFDGELLDFNAESFRIALSRPPSGSLRWINAERPVIAMFSRGGSLLYSGDCVVTRMGRGEAGRELVLAPCSSSIKRYGSREFRGQRQVLRPAPVVRFEHPLTGKQVCLQAEDISGAGICVEEFFERSVLLPGMIVPRVSIEIANCVVFECRAQVLYRNVANREEGHCAARCGLVFLDMAAPDQARLSAFIHQSFDGRLKVCGKVDMEELWRLFFESSFIYPSKYKSIESRKEEFKRTYEKLYLESPSIARHFLFQDKGQLFGHMSMLRFYPSSWIIHHHAASQSGYGLAGVHVMEEVQRFANDFYHHPSAHIDYLMGYYRRENRFPSRVFGGAVHDIGDQSKASLDAFAYLSQIPEPKDESPSFLLFPARNEDLAEARRFYKGASGGLMFEALGLAEGDEEEADRELSAEYARQGFRRERAAYCMRQGEQLTALLILSLSDVGLNLSNLTNCVHAIILDPALDPGALFSGIKTVLRRHSAENAPLLAYPVSYLDDRGVAYEKEYLLWVLDTERGDAYFASIARTFGRSTCGGEMHAEA